MNIFFKFITVKSTTGMEQLQFHTSRISNLWSLETNKLINVLFTKIEVNTL